MVMKDVGEGGELEVVGLWWVWTMLGILLYFRVLLWGAGACAVKDWTEDNSLCGKRKGGTRSI